LFSAWIYDTLKPYAEQLEMAHPAKKKAISAGKKKSDRLDARTIADLVRCNLLPACYVAPPRIRELRRLLRYRGLVVSEAVRMKNKMAGLLMEAGALYVKEKLHRKKYFASLLEELEEVPESVIDLLRLSRGALEMFESTQKRLVHELLADAELAQRVARLMTIPAVGEITALTWALEVGDPERFSLQLRRHKLLRIDGCMEVFGGQVQQHTLGVCAFLHHIHMYDQIRTEVRHVLASCSLADPELQGAQS
jgi:transposase